MNKKSIAIIGTVGLPANYGGFETLTEYLTRYLSADFNLTVYCSSKSYSNRLSEYNGAKLVYLPLQANGIQSIFYDLRAIFNALSYADVLLILGVSGCIVLPFIKLISYKKIIVNIDGLEWKREKWNSLAKWFLKLSEKIAIHYVDVVITDNKIIQAYIRNEYNRESQLIAYGGDHVERLPLSTEVVNKFNFLQQPYAFSVCRIEPENNLHILLDALAQQNKLHLVIVGNWQANGYGKKLQSQYSNFAHIHLLEPIYDQGLLNQIRSNCVVYLHGHSAGGTNPSLVEAMFLGLPIFAYNVNYNKETTGHAAHYFSDSEELFGLLSYTTQKELNTIGSKMLHIAQERYQWQIIAKQYALLFDN